MKCNEVRELFADEWAGTLDMDSRADLKSHLLECASCREERESLNRLWASLGDIPSEEPGPAMRPRFYSMLQSYQQDKDKAKERALHFSHPGEKFGRAFLLQPIFQFGLAAILLLAGFLGGYALKSSRDGQEELRNLREEVHAMRQMVTISLLKQQSASERLKGVSWSSQVSRPDSKFLSTLLNTLNYDPNVDVRLASVDAMSRFASYPEVRTGLIDSLAKQNSPLVQISLIDLLVQIHERQSIGVLRKIADDAGQNRQVRQRAEWGLQKLS